MLFWHHNKEVLLFLELVITLLLPRGLWNKPKENQEFLPCMANIANIIIHQSHQQKCIVLVVLVNKLGKVTRLANLVLLPTSYDSSE